MKELMIQPLPPNPRVDTCDPVGRGGQVHSCPPGVPTLLSEGAEPLTDDSSPMPQVTAAAPGNSSRSPAKSKLPPCPVDF